MKSRSTLTLKQVGEDRAIAGLLKLIGPMPDHIEGPGDDCAVIPVEGTQEDWVLTTDPVVEGVHFLADTEPRRIGHKAVGRVLSDLAAMGAEPQWLLINVTAPADVSFARLQQVYRGATALARKYGVTIIGGDVGQGRDFALHVFGIGRVPRGAALLRRGAAAGDHLYVTGSLGGSLAGRHLRFTPRLEEALWLREQGWPSAMMDVSDGLATDLRRLLKVNQLGAELEAASIPISKAARDIADAKTPLQHALSDGEDFELLFTVPAHRAPAFEVAWRETFRLRCTHIGTCTAPPVRLRLLQPDGRSLILKEHGYEHFVG